LFEDASRAGFENGSEHLGDVEENCFDEREMLENPDHRKRRVHRCEDVVFEIFRFEDF
jgi:hypothetical protein